MRRFVTAIVAVLLLAGCSGSSNGDASASPTVGDISLIQVGTADDGTPTFTWPKGVPYTKSQTQVMWPGEGEKLVDGQPLLFDMYVQSLETGEVLRDTYHGLPVSRILAPEMMGDDLYQTLLTVNVGARILAVVPPAGEFEDEAAFAVVIDVLPDHAVGEELSPSPDLPIVRTASTGAPLISIDPDQPLPSDLTVTTLIQGTGPQVHEGSFVLAQFLAVYGQDGAKGDTSWHAGDVKQTTWRPEQAPWFGEIAPGGVIKAWAEGLVDAVAGSRVMIIAPESYAYPGEGTLIYVIDILDVYDVPEGGSMELPSTSATPIPGASASASPSPASGGG